MHGGVGDDEQNGAVTMPTRDNEIADGLTAVRARIDAAARASGRTDPIGLVVVTKTFPAEDVAVLARLGVTDVAENRDQEARAKRAAAGDAAPLRWHMIGQLQRNKARSVARWADVVESVDRDELVEPLGAQSRELGVTREVLLQVSLDDPYRTDRGGAHPRSVLNLADRVASTEGLVLRGVMGVAPWPGDPDQAFARLAAIAESLQARWPSATVVSAGMSGDLEQAIAHGATQVRVGGAILGPRGAVQ